jgi:hypothetical protein
MPKRYISLPDSTPKQHAEVIPGITFHTILLTLDCAVAVCTGVIHTTACNKTGVHYDWHGKRLNYLHCQLLE